MKLTIREACRQRKPLGGADAEALEHGLTQVEAEFNKLVRYVRALRDFDYAPSAVIPLKLIEAYQDLNDETRKIIENNAS